MMSDAHVFGLSPMIGDKGVYKTLKSRDNWLKGHSVA